jgi:hypothetical protein
MRPSVDIFVDQLHGRTVVWPVSVRGRRWVMRHLRAEDSIWIDEVAWVKPGALARFIDAMGPDLVDSKLQLGPVQRRSDDGLGREILASLYSELEAVERGCLPDLTASFLRRDRMRVFRDARR